MRFFAVIPLAVVLACGVPAHGAKPVGNEPPAAFAALVECRKIGEAAARLACFDARSAELEAAAQRRELVVVDSKQMRDTRRTLFGLTLPRLAILGGDDEAAQVKSVEGVVSAARLDADSRWIVTLKDGATWRQIDSNVLGLEPRGGSKVVVRRAALGSFMMSVDKQPGIRVHRVN